MSYRSTMIAFMRGLQKLTYFITCKGMFIYYRRGDGSKMGGLEKIDEVRGGGLWKFFDSNRGVYEEKCDNQ